MGLTAAEPRLSPRKDAGPARGPLPRLASGDFGVFGSEGEPGGVGLAGILDALNGSRPLHFLQVALLWGLLPAGSC